MGKSRRRRCSRRAGCRSMTPTPFVHAAYGPGVKPQRPSNGIFRASMRADGRVDRAILPQKVLKPSGRDEKTESIVHPIVGRHAEGVFWKKPKPPAPTSSCSHSGFSSKRRGCARRRHSGGHLLRRRSSAPGVGRRDERPPTSRRILARQDARFGQTPGAPILSSHGAWLRLRPKPKSMLSSLRCGLPVGRRYSGVAARRRRVRTPGPKHARSRLRHRNHRPRAQQRRPHRRVG